MNPWSSAKRKAEQLHKVVAGRSAGDDGTWSSYIRNAISGIPVPIVIDKEGRIERSVDIFSRLLKDRIILLGMPIGDDIANLTIAQLLYLERENKKQDVSLYINSPGGLITSGLAIYDTMQYLECDVETLCIGQAASMAAVLLAAGAKQKRFALPHARILLHQPFAGLRGTALDIGIQAEEIVRLRSKLNDILAKHTGTPLEKVEQDVDRDYYMSAEEAKDYGIVDEVLTPAEPQ